MAQPVFRELSKPFLRRLESLYGESQADSQAKRYAALAVKARKAFGGEPRFFSAPGRTELGGNHTDHNRGRVLCAAVTLDALAAVLSSEDRTVEVRSEGWDRPFFVDLSSLQPDEKEIGTTEALIRGVAGGFAQAGYSVGGFRAILDSRVLPGSGLSSSAALEVLLGTILSELYNGGAVPPLEIARIGQRAENLYFGKPCGLMDQTASALGGVLLIDFRLPEQPAIRRIQANFEREGHALAIVSTGGGHENLQEDYAAVPREMRAAAAVFGMDELRGLRKEAFLQKIPEVRSAAGDRAVLRALHFLDENERVLSMEKALKERRFKRYLKLVRKSGLSSWRFLQNVIAPGNPREQSLALALGLTESRLGKRGACRVHGGGFAGTLQAYVPMEKLKEYRTFMERFFGTGCVVVPGIRNEGACEVKTDAKGD